MPERRINTSSGKLDKDLASLFGVLEGQALNSIKEALTDGTLTRDKLRELFPDGSLALAAGLVDPSSLEMIVNGETDDSRAVIDEARDRVLKELGDILAERIREIGADSPTHVSPLAENFKVISRLSHALTWFGEPESLIPAVRVGFIGRSDRLLLDSTLRVDDVAFVAEAMVKIMTEVLEGAADLSKQGRLDSQGWNKLPERLRAMDENLVKSKEFAAACGVEMDRGSSSDSDAADAPKK